MTDRRAFVECVLIVMVVALAFYAGTLVGVR